MGTRRRRQYTARCFQRPAVVVFLPRFLLYFSVKMKQLSSLKGFALLSPFKRAYQALPWACLRRVQVSNVPTWMCNRVLVVHPALPSDSYQHKLKWGFVHTLHRLIHWWPTWSFIVLGTRNMVTWVRIAMAVICEVWAGMSAATSSHWARWQCLSAAI